LRLEIALILPGLTFSHGAATVRRAGAAGARAHRLRDAFNHCIVCSRFEDKMDHRIARVIDEIANLTDDWHLCGSVSPNVLLAIARHAEEIGPIRHTAETGSGKTTLFFSHLSEDHLVFALQASDSMSQVECSPLFRSQTTRIIAGPTQQTLPSYAFRDKLQIVFLDGPHGYPFPDLEYYFLYPWIEQGGLLAIDDIKIPSIRRMYEIIKLDDMFDFLEIVDDNMALFRRTSVPVRDPLADNWWLQGYNRPYYDEITGQRPTVHSAEWHPAAPGRATAGMVRMLARVLPRSAKNLVPAKVKDRLLGAKS
jgi:hypothetical protein